MVGSIEKWRVAIGNMTDFVLLGSSYGGYLAGTYASRYPQHIRKLILATPLGVPFKPEECVPENISYADHATEYPPWAA
jgi:cardiolipin-specific phospholipase